MNEPCVSSFLTPQEIPSCHFSVTANRMFSVAAEFLPFFPSKLNGRRKGAQSSMATACTPLLKMKGGEGKQACRLEMGGGLWKISDLGQSQTLCWDWPPPGLQHWLVFSSAGKTEWQQHCWDPPEVWPWPTFLDLTHQSDLCFSLHSNRSNWYI